MASKPFTLLRLAAISLLVGATLAINAQTAQAQAPQDGLPTSGPRTSSSAPSVWFKQYCASCHGVEGTGDGPVAQSLRTKPADLTDLSKNNGGLLPEQEVHDFINGTKTVAAHGSQQMPVWGYAFRRVRRSDRSNLGSVPGRDQYQDQPARRLLEVDSEEVNRLLASA
jgi:mono/diheme cytochrome c family protein